MATCFGSEVSFDRHVARAEHLGLPLSIHRSDGVAFDLDAPDDLAFARDYAERGARLSWNRKRPSRVRAA
jgi:2-phospho-L-lactate guanylyltransferase (CobY/MobA/RfbA family)